MGMLPPGLQEQEQAHMLITYQHTVHIFPTPLIQTFTSAKPSLMLLVSELAAEGYWLPAINTGPATLKYVPGIGLISVFKNGPFPTCYSTLTSRVLSIITEGQTNTMVELH